MPDPTDNLRLAFEDTTGDPIQVHLTQSVDRTHLVTLTVVDTSSGERRAAQATLTPAMARLLHGSLESVAAEAVSADLERRPRRLEEVVDTTVKCVPCTKGLHGNCQGHTVTCWCTCSDGAADGGRLG